jgi:hypothetical protein
LDSIPKKAKIAVTSIAAWVAVAFLALALSGSDGFAFGAKPDLGVTVLSSGSDMRPVTAPGQPFSFTIGLDNMKGAADAHRVKLTTVLPKGLKFQNSYPPPTRLDSGYNPVWEIDTLHAKALPRLFEVTAETEADLAPGRQLEISAEAESSEGNANSSDNRASYTIYVQSVGPALVFLGSTLDSIPLTTDGPTTFKVDLRNAGNLPATIARLEATLPKEVKFDKADPQPESSSGQVVAFKLGDLARAESRSVTMTVEPDPSQLSDVLQGDRPLTFAFEVSGTGSGGKVTNSHFEITKRIESAGPDVAVWLAIEGAKEPGELVPGSNVTSVVTYANLGNQPAHKVVVALNLGPGLAIANSDPQPSGTGTNVAYPGGVAHWDIGDLGVGMSRTIRSVIHVTSVPDDGALLNATVTADGIDIDTSNNSASLLWHSPLPPDTLKSMRRASAVAKTAGGSEGASVRRVSHRLRHLFELILVIVAVLIFIRARRNT